MDGLRWLLLLFGLLVIAGVYLYGRRAREPEEIADERIIPALDDDSDRTEDNGAAADISDTESLLAAQEQKFVTLRIVAREQGSFAGDVLALSLRGIGMRHGKFGIFHRYDGNDKAAIIFSAASLVEPGSFDLSNLKEQKIPGISLFMVLPGPIDGPDAFDLMMVAARELAHSLDAELLDESGSTLSVQRERYMREEIIEYQTANMVS